MALTSSGRENRFYDDLETMSPSEREKYLNHKLFEAVRHAYENAPAAKEILDRARVSPEEIRTVKDLEKVPITRKGDLIELQRANPPYGGFLAIPAEEVERVFISPGPIYEPLHTAAIKWFAKSFHAAGFRKGDVVINTFTYHLSPAGILFHEGLRDCGATVVVTGTGNTEIQIQAMRALKVTGFVGTPSFLMTIIKRAEEMGYDFRRDFNLERAWFIGEMLPRKLRQTLEKDYGIDTRQAYGVTELGGAIAYECPEKSGMHFMDEYVIEIVDPGTGRQLGPGETGEIVVTPIHNRTWGLIRFGTGDMSSYTIEPCACGRTAPRLSGIMGRTSDAVKVRGMFVVAKQLEEMMMEFGSVSGFQMVVNRKDQRDEVELRIELKDNLVDKAKLASDVEKKFKTLCRVKLDSIEFVPKGNLQGEQKIIDKRSWD